MAHFAIRALEGQPITLFGDGKQVRDILHVEDLVRAFLAAQANMEALSGQAFNLGGGVENSTSLLGVADNDWGAEGPALKRPLCGLANGGSAFLRF